MILMNQKSFFEASKIRRRALLAMLGAAAVGGGCRPTPPEPEPGAGPRRPEAAEAAARPHVVATTTIVADLVRQVAGDRVTIESLMAAGVDPHSYKATPRDADRLARASLVVASGLHLEGRLADLLARLGERKPVVAVADALPHDRLFEAGAGLFDPHVWFEPRLWARCAAPVAEALARLDPAAAEAYAARAAAYADRLAALDAALTTRIAVIPAPKRVLVTAHDAFRYFGRAYGIEVVGVQGTSTESEAGLADINRLVDLIVARGLPAVFVETSVADRNVQALQEGARARGQPVALGGRLHSDSLGGPGSGAETLEEALRSNVETIFAGLTGGR